MKKIKFLLMVWLPFLHSWEFDRLKRTVLWAILPDYQDNKSSDSPVDENSRNSRISILAL